MACLFLLVIRFSLHVPCDVFTITNEDNHVETDQMCIRDRNII